MGQLRGFQSLEHIRNQVYKICANLKSRVWLSWFQYASMKRSLFQGSDFPQKQHSGAAVRLSLLLQRRFKIPEPGVPMH